MDERAALKRPSTTVEEASNPFLLDVETRSYKHQYSNIYFTRLHHLKDAVQRAAEAQWKDIAESPELVPRLLEVVKGRVCYIIGTVYMDMPLKPNVLEDLARDRSIPPPAAREKFWSEDDGVMLEDESGRIRLAGDRLKKEVLVTGVIMAALGMENPNGDFEVVDICFPEVCPNQSAAISGSAGMNGSADRTWVALVSGLDIGSEHYNEASLQMLVEYLSGELVEKTSDNDALKISRLVLVGNSVASSNLAITLDSTFEPTERKPVQRRNAKELTTFSRHPVEVLSDHLLDIATSMPVHVLPGETDPTGAILPQQALPSAMFGAVSELATFHSETNPAIVHLSSAIEGEANRTRDMLLTSGQTLNDMFKYVQTPPTTRLDLAEATLFWRHLAPTAPDTLWCHPYFTKDPFVLEKIPDLYIIGNQPEFATKLIVSATAGGEPLRCRVILVPSFSHTGTLVLVDIATLEVRIIELRI